MYDGILKEICEKFHLKNEDAIELVELIKATMKSGLSQWVLAVQSASSTNEMIQRRIVKELRKVLHFHFAKIIGLVKVNGNTRL